MSILNIALVFLISWWLGWFLTLPFGVKGPEKVEPGHAASAPDKPRLLVKAVISTAIACVITAVVVVIVQSGWIDLRE